MEPDSSTPGRASGRSTQGFTGSLPTPSTSSSEQTRRRMQSSSGDSEPHPPSKPILVARYRVASPILRPTPLTMRHGLFPPKLQSCVIPIRDATEKILDNHKLMDEDVTEVFLLYRQKPDVPNTSVPTVFIVNPWKEDSPKSWSLAVKEIVAFIDKFLADAECDEALHVEMIAPERLMPKYLHPAPSLPDLAWPELRSTIHQKLDNYQATRNYVTAIGLFRLGFSPSPSFNPITVYVSLEDDSDETQWGAITRHLESYLHDLGWANFVVHLEHNVVRRWAFDLNLPAGGFKVTEAKMNRSKHLINGEYQGRVNLGDSIGAAQYLHTSGGSIANPSAGTLGCYIEIRMKGETTWEKFGLTNYHVMRPCLDGFVLHETKVDPPHTPDPEDTPEQIKVDSVALVQGTPRRDSELWKADHAVFRQAKYRPMILESPVRVKHNYTVWYLDTMIQNMRKQTSGIPLAEKMETEKANKISFFDNERHKYGKVRMASGFGRRTPQRNHRLDWAVIEVNSSRIGENRLPTWEVWKSTTTGLHTPNPDTFGALLQPPHPSRSLKTMALGTSVWKIGASSGPTAGVYNEYKVECTIKDDAHVRAIRIDGHTVTVSKYSEQFVITGRNELLDPIKGRVCGPGDSGAVVFNERGEAVGLLFSGQKPDQAQAGYGLVTPIEDVFADIKACAKGQIEDIRIAMA